MKGCYQNVITGILRGFLVVNVQCCGMFSNSKGQNYISSIMCQPLKRFLKAGVSLCKLFAHPRKTGFIPISSIYVFLYALQGLYMQFCTEERICPFWGPVTVGRNELDVTVLSSSVKTLHFWFHYGIASDNWRKEGENSSGWVREDSSRVFLLVVSIWTAYFAIFWFCKVLCSAWAVLGALSLLFPFSSVTSPCDSLLYHIPPPPKLPIFNLLYTEFS